MTIVINIRDNACSHHLTALKNEPWPFPVRFVESQTFDKNHPIYLDENGLYLGLKSGLNDIFFSWEDKLHHWTRDRSISAHLMKALGCKKGDKVIDATAGFGFDTSYLLHHGLEVVAFERTPILYTLLRGSLLLYEKALPLTLNFGAASDHVWDCPVYFDPMYDAGDKRSAASKKEMSFLHELVGADEDAEEQARLLRQKTKRLVIKRPPRLPPMLPHRNSYWESKAVRFDLYL